MLQLQAPSNLKSFTMLHGEIMKSTSKGEIIKTKTGLSHHFWSRKWQPTQVFLPRKFHEQRRLVGYRPWGHKRDEDDFNK